MNLDKLISWLNNDGTEAALFTSEVSKVMWENFLVYSDSAATVINSFST